MVMVPSGRAATCASAGATVNGGQRDGDGRVISRSWRLSPINFRRGFDAIVSFAHECAPPDSFSSSVRLRSTVVGDRKAAGSAWRHEPVDDAVSTLPRPQFPQSSRSDRDRAPCSRRGAEPDDVGLLAGRERAILPSSPNALAP